VTAADLFAAAAAILHGSLGDLGWLTLRAGPQTAVKVILANPGREDMVGDGPIAYSPELRWIDLLAATGAATGDLVTVAGRTWILGRAPDADLLGLSHRWLGVPLVMRVGAIPYHLDGYPLVEWNGLDWVAVP
jgi:hypothetical protein